MFDLKGKVAVVTGGNGGIGLGMARGLASAGAQVVVVGRNEAKSRKAVKDLEGRGSRAFALAVDVGDEGAVTRMVEEVDRRCGRLDILVNNAGTNIRKPPHELALDEWSFVLNTNLTSAFLCSKAAYPLDEARGRRQDHQHRLDDVDLRHLLRPRLRGEQGGHRAAHQVDGGGLGQGQHPGERGAAGLDRHRADSEGAGGGARPQRERSAPDAAGRWGTWDDCAGIAVFLSAPASDFVTGTAIPLDGGFSVQG